MSMETVEVVRHHITFGDAHDLFHHSASGNLAPLSVPFNGTGIVSANHRGERGEGEPFSGEIVLKRHTALLATLAKSRQAKLAKCGQDSFSRIGYARRMAANPNMIREIRKAKGLTLQQLGELTKHPKTGNSTDLATIQKLEAGKRTLNADWRFAIAEALGVHPDDLVGATVPRTPVRRVPLIGKIPAGNWRLAVEDATDLIPCTSGGPNTFALKPEGDSMDLLLKHDDAVVFCDPDDKALRNGSNYAMMKEGGEVTFKQYRDNPPRLRPLSSNPAHQEMLLGEEPLVTIGRITGMHVDFR